MGGRTWGTVWVFSITMMILMSMYSSMMEDMEHMRQLQEPPPLSDIPYHLPAFRRLEGSTSLARLAAWSKQDKTTPLLVSYSPATWIKAILAGEEAGVLPKEGLSLISITASSALWPPDESNRYGDIHQEIRAHGELQIAGALRGHVDRVFTVTPAPDLRELLLINGGDVTFRHITRSEPASSHCLLRRRAEAAWVLSNSSLHHASSEVPHAFAVGMTKMQHPVGVPKSLPDDAAPSFSVYTSLEVASGTPSLCCLGCLAPQEAAKAAPSPPLSANFSSEQIAKVEEAKLAEARRRREEEEAKRSREEEAAAKFFAWTGELADADREAEVAFDADLLLDAFQPAGEYVLAVDYSFFTDPSSASPPHPACQWLVREEAVQQCVLPLANDRGHLTAGERYLAGLTNIALAALSNRQPPTQMPVKCLQHFKEFRYFFWKALNRENKLRFGAKHPTEAVGEMCGQADMRNESPRRAWAREAREINWMKRRIETLRKYLLAIQKRLHPPAIILLAKVPSAFALVSAAHTSFLQHDVIEALKTLRSYPSDFTILNAEYDYERSD